MSLELLTKNENKHITALEGLEKLRESAYTMSQNMKARIETPVLKDGTDLWDVELNSRTMHLHAIVVYRDGVGADYRNSFKIDNDADLSKIIGKEIADGSVSISKEQYKQSNGTEFIILDQMDIDEELPSGSCALQAYAIRADKYKKIHDKVKGNSQMDVKDFLEMGGFKLDHAQDTHEIIKYDKTKKPMELTWENIESVHDGWLEYAVGKNKKSGDDYLAAARLLAEYVNKAEEKGCFDIDTHRVIFYANATHTILCPERKILPISLSTHKYEITTSGTTNLYRRGFHFRGSFLREPSGRVA